MSRRAQTIWTFAITSIALFMTTLDNLVVTTALPTMQRDLHASISGLEWTVNAYTLTFAVLLMLGVATRVLAAGLAIDMIVALATVRIGRARFTSGPQAGGWELEFLLFALSLALVFTGAGRFALDPSLGL